MLQACPDAVQQGVAALQVDGIHLLFREIQHRLDQHAQVDQFVDHAADGGGKLPVQGAHRTARRLGGVGLDQVGNAFRLSQVKLVVQESALREFAGLRQPRAQIEAALQDHLQDGVATVPLQFEHIFAGVGMRGGEKQGDPLVQRIAVFIEKFAVGGMPCDGQLAQDATCQRSSSGPDILTTPMPPRLVRWR